MSAGLLKDLQQVEVDTAAPSLCSLHPQERQQTTYCTTTSSGKQPIIQVRHLVLLPGCLVFSSL
jgi:hypothetical protein